MPREPRCPKCGNLSVAQSGCPRRGWNRHGGVNSPSTVPIPCHRTDNHAHFSCIAAWYSDSGGVRYDKSGCGHNWTV